MWKVVTSFNLNPPLKLFFYSPILTHNNLLLKIYYENIVVIFFNYDFLFFILFFFLSFLFFFFLFSFSCFSPPHKCPAPFFYFLFHLKNIPTTDLLHIRERERAARPSPHYRSSSSPPPGWVRLAFFFFSFFFLFFHICLFWFNFILRIGFCFVFGLCEKRGQIGFFFFFIFACSDSTLF